MFIISLYLKFKKIHKKTLIKISSSFLFSILSAFFVVLLLLSVCAFKLFSMHKKKSDIYRILILLYISKILQKKNYIPQHKKKSHMTLNKKT